MARDLLYAQSHRRGWTGVIRTRELRDLEEEEITEELRPQGVLNVRRIIIKRDGETIKTGTYILTFGRPTPPKKLRVYLSVEVDLFIPNPLRCFQCQKFGHGRDSCRGKAICFRCGQDGHDNCQNPAKCTNCRGDHPATSKDCPVWKKEKEIQRVKTENWLSYPEARRLVEVTSPSPTTRTYAAIAKPSTRTVDCQTELTWLDRDKPQRSGPVKSPVAAPASNSTTSPFNNSVLKPRLIRVRTTSQSFNQQIAMRRAASLSQGPVP